MANCKHEPKEKKFKNFENYKKLVGIISNEFFLDDKLFQDYIKFHKKFRYRDDFFLKEILFECLPYPHYFTFHKGFVEFTMNEAGVNEKTFYEWFTEFLKAGLIRRVSKTVFKRMSRFDLN